MRFEGKGIGWDDARGFGYITLAQGGQNIFAHVSAFAAKTTRPQDGQLVTFEVFTSTDGRKRAKNVQLAKRQKQAPLRRSGRSATPTHRRLSSSKLIAIPSFGLLYLAVHMLWHPPATVAALYVGMSVGTFVAYAADKSAARSGAWRIAESKLHLGAMMCGWPGALLAQSFLRHKSSKQSFRETFWFTVALNVVGFITLSSPYGQRLFHQS